ncbi:hypothetical protein PQI23_12610 [Leucobacter sp. USCH14]|uniref:hypothetical protein n=1 Tax=Leucobacter sp. USCH14 TaxID=3024838 RepID=UPI0030AFE3BE
MAPSDAPAYEPFVIALFDEIDPGGSTVVYGDDPQIWEWLVRAEPIAPGRESVKIPIPGTHARAHVTIWAPRNDKAQHLTRVPGTMRVHPSLVELELGSAETLDFRAAYARLLRAIPHDRVFEGTW